MCGGEQQMSHARWEFLMIKELYGNKQGVKYRVSFKTSEKLNFSYACVYSMLQQHEY